MNAPSKHNLCFFHATDEAAVLRTLQELLEDASENTAIEFISTANEALERLCA